MVMTDPHRAHKVLLVDDDDAVRNMMAATLEHKGFEVISAANATEALRHIASERFDVLITDQHMPNPGDGSTVVTAMRHSQPEALTLLISGNPDVQSAMAAIVLQQTRSSRNRSRLANLRIVSSKQCLSASPLPSWKSKEWVRYSRCVASVVEGWLIRANESKLNHVPLSDDERTGHLPKLVEDLIVRLGKPSATTKDSDAVSSAAATAHGKLRFEQGYTPAMLVNQVTNTTGDSLRHFEEQSHFSGFQSPLARCHEIADEVDAN